MTTNEAIELLKHHSFTHQDINNPKSENGFLGMLRPFGGELNEDNFHELIEIIRVLKNKFCNESIETSIISNLWSICHLSRVWGLESQGMLRANNLINQSQIQLLSNWIDCISYAVMCLLDDSSELVAFEPYRSYLEKRE